MPGQSGPLRLPVLVSRHIGKAQAVAPLHELTARGSQPPQGGHRPVPAPGDHAVRQGGQPFQGGRVPGGHLKGVQPGGQPGLPLGEQLQGGQGQPPVPVGELDEVEIPREQPLQSAEQGKPHLVARGDVEEHPQGLDQGPAKGPLHQSSRPQVPQLQLEPLLQGLPADHPPHRPQLLQRARGRVLGQQRVQLSGIQSPAQAVHRVQHHVHVQGRAGPGLIQPLLQRVQEGGQLLLGEQCSGGKDHENPSPLPSSSAAPAAQVWISGMPTRPKMVR